MIHIPVLLNKVLEILSPTSGKFVIDGTVDGGGHAAEIVKKLEPNGIFLGIDLDSKMIEKVKSRIKSETVKVILTEGNYVDTPKILKSNNLDKADGLLLDLGFSSEQINESGKGFSFSREEPLIMKYSKEGPTAAEVVNSFNQKEMEIIFREYGEERYARKIASKIVEMRKKERIVTTSKLVEIIKSAVPKSYERGRIHPATRTFQALRIYVNQELNNLETILQKMDSILKPGGVAIIISFHSLEDRLVKNYFRNMEKSGLANALMKKPIVPDEEEIKNNPKSRSAKLRAIKIKSIK